MAGLDVGHVGQRFVAVGRLPAHRPRKALGIVPFRRPRAEEQLRDFPVVEIFVHGVVGRRPDRAEYQQHLIA